MAVSYLLLTTLGGRCYAHFRDKEIEAQRI